MLNAAVFIPMPKQAKSAARARYRCHLSPTRNPVNATARGVRRGAGC
jgi:hypothetical protein